MEKTYPAIAKRAKAEKADILWGDETGISNQDHAGRGYAPVGETPVVRGLARRITTSMISAIGNRGEVRFMIYKGGLKTDTFIRFLGRLIKSAKRKIFLIVDNLRVHKAVKVVEWTKARAKQIELFYMPPYSPELNPDEYFDKRPVPLYFVPLYFYSGLRPASPWGGSGLVDGDFDSVFFHRSTSRNILF